MAGAERSDAARRTDGYLRQADGMRAERVDFDRKWQMVSDYQLPRRDFSVTQRPNALRPHRVTSSVPTNAGYRLAVMLLAYWIDITRPFLLPNVKRGLAMVGRDTNLDDDGLNYLGALSWNVFDHMMRPKAQLMLRLGSMLKEFVFFGCGVLWTGRRRGFGPYFNNRPLSSCWWAENEEGVIDTLYYRLNLPIYRVMQRWPAAAALWRNNSDDQPNELNLTEILLACRPRAGGKVGAVGEAKPFEFTAISVEKGAVLEESGYDSFPYAVFRYDPMPGATYAEGPGCQVQPDVMVLNHLVEAIEDVASQKARPPIGVPMRMFGKTLDRRPSAVNLYNPSLMGLQRVDQAIIKMDFTGEVTECEALKQSLTGDIELGFFTDWMRLRNSGDVPAEEIIERRDIRLRGMASIVANMEMPTSLMGERAMSIMLEEGSIPPGPASVAGADVDWEYAGPLQIAQLRGNVQAMLQLINARGLVAGQDPAAAQAVDLETALRVVADSLGGPPSVMNSRAKVQAAREAQAHEAQQQADAEKLSKVAGAARDGGSGVASALGALQGGPGGAPGGGGPGAAPFAPAAPFAQPAAA